MMMSEFTERTGFEPTAEEYTEIEEAYYRFNGDKNAFCKHWMETVGVKGICKARAEKAAELRSTMILSKAGHLPFSSPAILHYGRAASYR